MASSPYIIHPRNLISMMIMKNNNNSKKNKNTNSIQNKNNSKQRIRTHTILNFNKIKIQNSNNSTKSTNWKKHWQTKVCQMNSKRLVKFKERMMMENIANEGIKINKIPLKHVSNCKYLGRVVTDDRNDYLAAAENVKNSRKKWIQVKKIITSFDCIPKIMKYLYRGTVMPTLLYGSETWNIDNG